MKNIIQYTEQVETGRLFPTNRSRQFGTMGEIIQPAGESFLAEIHGEIGDWKEQEASARAAWEQEQRDSADKGLTSEVNTKVEGWSISDTVERCSALLARHPFGFKDSDETGSELIGQPITA